MVLGLRTEPIMRRREFVTLLGNAALAQTRAFLTPRERPVIDDRTGARVYQFGDGMKTVGWVCAVAFPLFALSAALAHPPKDEEVIYVVLFLAFGPVVGVPLLWPSLRYRLMVSDDGLDCRSPWIGHRFVPWSEVDRVS